MFLPGLLDSLEALSKWDNACPEEYDMCVAANKVWIILNSEVKEMEKKRSAEAGTCGSSAFQALHDATLRLEDHLNKNGMAELASIFKFNDAKAIDAATTAFSTSTPTLTAASKTCSNLVGLQNAVLVVEEKAASILAQMPLLVKVCSLNWDFTVQISATLSEKLRQFESDMLSSLEANNACVKVTCEELSSKLETYK
jgi:hypothetical protein